MSICENHSNVFHKAQLTRNQKVESSVSQAIQKACKLSVTICENHFNVFHNAQLTRYQKVESSVSQAIQKACKIIEITVVCYVGSIHT